MDELWQRYRTFWTPLLVGVGVFLVGLVVIHVITDDPAVARARVTQQERRLRGKHAPASRTLVDDVRSTGAALQKRVREWAPRLDQAGGADPLDAAVEQALQAALLRGMQRDRLQRAAQDADERALARFDGDAVLAARAVSRFDGLRREHLDLLRRGDSNVAFFRLLHDVWSELRLRANRADVDLRADVLGFGSITSVGRGALLERVLNLALVARVVDLAIREGVRSVDRIAVDARPSTEDPEAFLRAWPVTVTVTGDMASVQPLLLLATDPERPIPLAPPGSVLQSPSGATSALQGLVQAQLVFESVLVRPDAVLDLTAEEVR